MISEIPMEFISGSYQTGNKFINKKGVILSGEVIKDLVVSDAFVSLASYLECTDILEIHYDDIDVQLETISDADIEDFQNEFTFGMEILEGLIRDGIISDEQITRQKKKIVVLYNDDPHLLMTYVSPENSDIAQRFTDLFAGMLRTDDSENKPSIIKVGNKFYEDSLIHRTTRGELVRSKSEVVIADHLLSNKINYDYEPEVTVGDKKFRPDFVAYDPDDDDIFWYWEHVGMPTDPGYMARWENKKAYYAEHGIIEGKNLIIICDGDDGSLDAQVIDKLIKKTFDLD